MNKFELTEASEEKFLDEVRARIREKGRSRFIDAFVDDDSEVGSVADGNDGAINSAASVSDDSDDSGRDYDGESAAEDDDDTIDSLGNHGNKVQPHDRIVHDHIHCPPFPDMSSTFCGALCGVCDCEDFSAMFARKNF